MYRVVLALSPERLLGVNHKYLYNKMYMYMYKYLSQCVVHVYMLFSTDASHAFVMFFEEEGQPTSVIPVKHVIDYTAKDLKAGVDCKVKWSDQKIYSTRVVAVGKSYTHMLVLYSACVEYM